MNDGELDRYIDAAAKLAGLDLTDAQRPGVRLYFERTATMAALVNAFPLPHDVEAPPMFKASPDAE